KLVLEAWDQYYVDLRAAFRASNWKISFMADIWSSKGMNSYLAITAHWLSPRGDDDQVVLCQASLAF
ncbi:hypothetical protein B0H19DRAFT_910792, partial [Mycena capillaripes]